MVLAMSLFVRQLWNANLAVLDLSTVSGVLPCKICPVWRKPMRFFDDVRKGRVGPIQGFQIMNDVDASLEIDYAFKIHLIRTHS